MTDYATFLESKQIIAAPAGFEVSEINDRLFDFQQAIGRWALRRGRAAIFADCGLGKTPIQLEWAQRVVDHTGQPVLILAPLAVSAQTAREGEKFGIGVTVCASQTDVRLGVNATNYEKLHHFDPAAFGGVVLDESSILKSFDGSTRTHLIEAFAQTPYRLACTATPAPNDLIELVNHAEFLGIMREKEIKALFFTQDGNSSHTWRLKGHAEHDFWRWLASWCVALRKPSDLGYTDDDFVLPLLTFHDQVVESTEIPEGYLFAIEAKTLIERRAARRDSLGARVRAAADLANASDAPWLIWCDLNAEGDALAKAIPGAVQVAGSDTANHKERSMLDFATGRIRVLISKPSICGFGMNWQHCANVAFVGLSDSYEQLYQAIRRCWRFGQTQPVQCHIITSEAEGAVRHNIERKERQAMELFDNLVGHMQGLALDGATGRNEMVYREDRADGRGWRLYLGDSVTQLADVADNSIGLTVTSPPFPGMYVYTNSAHDMGNVRDIDEMLAQFRFLIPELLRVTMPGRNCCIHLTQTVALKSVDGYIGIKDFRGRVIAAMEDAGWVYYGEVCIDKNPQVKAARTNDQGLQFRTMATDSARCHMALADYLLQFKKPGENPIPIASGMSRDNPNPSAWITAEEWIEWAAPVWYRATPGLPGGIRETDVLNVASAREASDERHLCPLQLGVIERAIKLWSAPGDLVLDPFAGVGSTGYEAVRWGRRFIGCELKESYWRQATKNLTNAEDKQAQPNFFNLVDEVAA